MTEGAVAGQLLPPLSDDQYAVLKAEHRRSGRARAGRLFPQTPVDDSQAP